MGTYMFKPEKDWERVEGEERKGETHLVHPQGTKIHRPVFGSEACPVYFDVYIQRGDPFFY